MQEYIEYIAVGILGAITSGISIGYGVYLTLKVIKSLDFNDFSQSSFYLMKDTDGRIEDDASQESRWDEMRDKWQEPD